MEEFTSYSSAYDSIPGVSEITSSCTAYAAERVIEQLNVSLKIPYSVSSEDVNGSILVSYKEKQYELSLSSHTCSCTFSRTMGLPCRHIFAARAMKELPTFELSMVSKRWHKDYQLSVHSETVDQFITDDCSPGHSSVSICSLPSTSAINRTLSRNQKYNKMFAIGKKLASIACEFGMPEFRRKIGVIESILHHWENNSEVEVVAIQETDTQMVSSVIIAWCYSFTIHFVRYLGFTGLW